MKNPLFWTESEISVIENNESARDAYGHYYGSEIIELREEHITALRDGKQLAWNDSEYSTFVILEKEKEIKDETHIER